MGDLSITDAVRLSGKSQSSILRAIKSGALSARRGPGGAFLIDRSELARVYAVGSPAPDGAPDGAVLRHEIDRLRADLADAERRAAVAGLWPRNRRALSPICGGFCLLLMLRCLAVAGGRSGDPRRAYARSRSLWLICQPQFQAWRRDGVWR